jgi:hypothetical protein
MLKSASVYRWQRVDEDLKATEKLSVGKAIEIMRDMKGLHNTEIGLGNEKAINQLIAHHSIIFQPKQLKVWISTSPYQLGEYVCYDLNNVFDIKNMTNQEIYEAKRISSDPFLGTKAYVDFTKFARYRFPFQPRTDLQPDSLVKWNPDSYHSYMLAGDKKFDENNFSSAIRFYEQGLTKEVATVQERDYMSKRIQLCKEKLQ